jgi:hypothetical protein
MEISSLHRKFFWLLDATPRSIRKAITNLKELSRDIDLLLQEG